MPSTVPNLTTEVKAAAAALDAGQASEARDRLAALLPRHADHAEVRFYLARADLALGSLEDAREGLDAALAGAPGEPAIWMEMALLGHLAGTGKAVVKRARAAGIPTALVTMIAAASTGKGARAIGTGAATKRDLATMSARLNAADFRGVETLGVPLAQRKPGAALLWVIGQARLRAGAIAQAVEVFRQGLKLEPYAVDLRLGLAQSLLRHGQRAAALAEARRAADQAPAWVDAQITFARVALAVGAHARAKDAVRRAENLAPKSDTVLVLAAELALATGRGADALAYASRRKPSARGHALLVGQAAAAARDTDAALASYAEGLKRSPKDADLLLARAQLLQSSGNAAGAERDLRQILALEPGHGLAARTLAYGTRLDPEDEVVRAMKGALASARTPADARLLHYALARVTERVDPKTSFDHLRTANAATASAFPYDASADEQEIARITGPDWDALQALEEVSDCAAAPVFVTGLPRSGTTLVETILASHSAVRAGGELAVLNPIMSQLSAKLAAGTATAADLTGAGSTYATRALEAAGQEEAARLTDKSIHTYIRMGHVGRILPKSRVVVVQRDPRDTGLSIWRNHFQDGTHRYAATFEGIADHIAQFQRTVAFWRTALPQGSFHEIHYEDLLADPEAEARKLLSFVGLPWEDAVLRFHETAGRVDTLSFSQVRQPLYTSSKGGWRAHAEHIAPLIEALAERDALPDE